jgi:hypothetical protein
MQDSLAKLITIESRTADNVFCSAVIMHLPQEQIGEAVFNLIRLTKGGIVLVSYRGTSTEDNRKDGRL